MQNQKVLFIAVLVSVGLMSARAGRAQIGQSPACPEEKALKSDIDQGTRQPTYLGVRLTNDGAESVHPRVAVNGDYLYLVWEDTRSGNRDVFWRKFSADGLPESVPVNLSQSSSNSVVPQIGVSGAGNSYVVWQEGTLYGTVYGSIVSTDGAVTTTATPLGPNLCLDPDITVQPDGTNWVVFHRRAPSDQDVYVRRFDSSFSLLCTRRVNKGTLPEFDKHPSVCVDGAGRAYVFWRDLDSWWNDGIYYARVTTACVGDQSRRQASGDYDYPSTGWSGAWPWTAAYAGGNIYNLYGDNGVFRINDSPGSAGRPDVGSDPDYSYVVWRDDRHGDNEIYLSRAFQDQSFADVRLTEHASNQNNPAITSLNAEPGHWWVVWEDNRHGNWEIYMTRWDYLGVAPSFIVRDSADPPQPIPNSLCRLYRVNPDHSETFVGSTSTDSAGVLIPDPGWFGPGDLVRIELLAHRLETQRPMHGDVNGTAHKIVLDNANVRSDGPLEYHDEYGGAPDQEVILHHATVKYNLIVMVEWDMSPAHYQDLKTALRLLANYMYDITDGQATLDTVVIWDEGYRTDQWQRWDAADVKIKAVNFLNKTAEADWGYYGFPYENKCFTGYTRFPRVVYGASREMNIDLTTSESVNWAAVTASYLGTTNHYPGVKALAHELGHYLFYLGEEYVARASEADPDSCAGTVPTHDFGLMESTELLEATPENSMYGEMSSQWNYDQVGPDPKTHQWCHHSAPCWSAFETAYEGNVFVECSTTVDHPFVRITRPDEVPGYTGPFIGPNNDLQQPDVDVGELVTVMDSTKTYQSAERKWRLLRLFSPEFMKPALVTVEKASGEVVEQGITSFNNEIELMGVATDDIAIAISVNIFGSTIEVGRWHIGSASVLRDEFYETQMVAVIPNHPLAIVADASGAQQIQIVALFDTPFDSNPTLNLIGDDGSTHSEQLQVQGNSYVSSAGIQSGASGTATVEAVDDSGTTFPILIEYEWTESETGAIRVGYGPLNECTVVLDTTSDSVSGILLARYDYLVPTDGLPAHGSYSSSLYSMSVNPPSESFTSPANIAISYTLGDSSDFVPDSLAVYQWDRTAWSWVQLASEVDTVAGYCAASIDGPGLFLLAAASASCCNGDGMRGNVDDVVGPAGEVSVGDLTYLVAYLFQGGQEPSCEDESNVDGTVGPSSPVDVADLTYLVSYLFLGGAAPAACP